MTRFLKLIIEPIYVADPELGSIDIVRKSVKNGSKGSNGSGEYLFNLNAILAPVDKDSLDRATVEGGKLCTSLRFVIGRQQAYQGVEFIWGELVENFGEFSLETSTEELIGIEDYQDALAEINEQGNFGDITSAEQLVDAICAAQRIWEPFVNPQPGNTKLASVVSSRDFKGKVYNNKGALVELVGWKFYECDQ